MNLNHSEVMFAQPARQVDLQLLEAPALRSSWEAPPPGEVSAEVQAEALAIAIRGDERGTTSS